MNQLSSIGNAAFYGLSKLAVLCVLRRSSASACLAAVRVVPHSVYEYVSLSSSLVDADCFVPELRFV
jgi:hypothetical protein